MGVLAASCFSHLGAGRQIAGLLEQTMQKLAPQREEQAAAVPLGLFLNEPLGFSSCLKGDSSSMLRDVQ